VENEGIVNRQINPYPIPLNRSIQLSELYVYVHPFAVSETNTKLEAPDREL